MKYPLSCEHQVKRQKQRYQKLTCLMFDQPIIWFTSTCIKICQILSWGVGRSLDDKCNALFGRVCMPQKGEVAQGQ